LIGVVANRDEYEAVEEFFQLFKTPWEFFRPEKKYKVLLCTTMNADLPLSDLTILFSSHSTTFDREHTIQVESLNPEKLVYCQEGVLPLYKRVSRLGGQGWDHLLTIQATDEPVAIRKSIEGQTTVRVGFDLFLEVRHLLTRGQRIDHALIPTIDRFISTMRKWILDAGIPVCEIPPTPDGYRFIGCMTHDVDFLRFRDHFMDRTFFGFLHRVLFSTPRNFILGKVSFNVLIKNLVAVLLSPMVYLGLLNDFWDLAEKYADIEGDIPSTFFIIPFKGVPGENPDGSPDPGRRSRYGADDLGDYLNKSLERGCEIAVHGIDSWVSPDMGEKERSAVSAVTDIPAQGMRTHWLYFSPDSFRHLEEAGFTYDSSIGYNEAVGFRCGTTQAFRPLGVNVLLEIPLHVMDTALLYPGRMSLGYEEAMSRIKSVLAPYRSLGGVMTINWHHRSIGPERYWDELYMEVVAMLKDSEAWFATASSTAKWFRKRRLVSFQEMEVASDRLRIKGSCSEDNSSPGLVLRIHLPVNSYFGSRPNGGPEGISGYQDFPVTDHLDLTVPIVGSNGKNNV
jgi:hypothetical protein